ncbi:MAG: hypothetical protein ACHQ6T_15915 [Myxococcota bacterium]
MSDDRDRDWIDSLRAEFRPEPMTAERAAEFRRTLEARIDTGARNRRFALPALALATAAAAALWLALPATAPLAPAASASSAEADAFVDPDALASDLAQQSGYLPADYQGLALLIEDEKADR